MAFDKGTHDDQMDMTSYAERCMVETFLENIMVAAVLITGLAVSGCNSTQEETLEIDNTAPVPLATPAANRDIMYSEISNRESDMAERDILSKDRDDVEGMSFTKLNGLTF